MGQTAPPSMENVTAPAGWTFGTTHILRGDPESNPPMHQRVVCLVSSRAPHLAVTHAIGAARETGRFVVTHAPTGTRLGTGFKSESTACAVAEKLAALGDWGRPTSELRADKALAAGKHRIVGAALRAQSKATGAR